MKKVMMFVAMAVCASSIQAAQIVWANNADARVKDLDGNNILSSNVSTYNLIVQLINVTAGDVVVATATGIDAMTPGSLTGTTYDYTFGVDSTTGDLYKIMMYATFGGDNYYMEITNPSWTVTALNNGVSEVFGWASGSTAAGNWVLVPEPTAMALLALGAAAFGLRRRFRK